MPCERTGMVTAIRIIVKVMCNTGLMSGWFGDTGEDFRDQQVFGLLRLWPSERRVWIDNNRSNLLGVGVPWWVLMVAKG